MTAIAKLTERFTETAIDDEIVIMRLDNGEFFSLSGTAAALWRLIDGTRDKASLIAAAANEYDVAEIEIETDVDDLLRQLAETGLLAPG
jgi:Coenzyme PQQ synthesis protein D (PqqD)